MNLSDLLDTINKQLAAPAALPEYIQPCRSVKYLEVLTPVGFEWRPVIVNIYDPNPYPVGLEIPETHSVVIHGHGAGVGCSAPYFCHALDYTPTGAEHPSFLKQWRFKWNI